MDALAEYAFKLKAQALCRGAGWCVEAVTFPFIAVIAQILKYIASIDITVRCMSGDTEIQPTSIDPILGLTRRYDAIPIACWSRSKTV